MRMRPVRGIADLQRDRSRGFCAGRIFDDILELDLSRIVVLGRIGKRAIGCPFKLPVMRTRFNPCDGKRIAIRIPIVGE